MSQEEAKENFDSNKNAIDSTGENLNPEEITTGLSPQANSEEVENLPIGSIGSYARIDELLVDEDSENPANPTPGD